jgi:hypothetical protein
MRGLPIPEELIRIIKDYTFLDIVSSDSKWKKDVIIRLINKTIWCGRACPKNEDKGILIFWIEGSGPQFQKCFCKKCGQYEFSPIGTITCLC